MKKYLKDIQAICIEFRGCINFQLFSNCSKRFFPEHKTMPPSLSLNKLFQYQNSWLFTYSNQHSDLKMWKFYESVFTRNQDEILSHDEKNSVYNCTSSRNERSAISFQNEIQFGRKPLIEYMETYNIIFYVFSTNEIRSLYSKYLAVFNKKNIC